MSDSLVVALTVVLSGFHAATSVAQEAKPSEAVSATVETTLQTASGQIRQFAFDGDDSTSFVSKESPRETDHFTLVIDRPVTVKSISVTTGNVDGSEGLDTGVLEVSSDGKTFETAAKFVHGLAQGDPKQRDIVAFRIKPTAEQKHPLRIREWKIESNPPVIPFQYPIEFTVESTDAPELQSWADKTARLCERWYPRINVELMSDGYKPPHQVTMTLKTSYNGVAEAGGNRITGSVKFFKAHPDDVGAMIHETCHVVQNYRRRGNPSWLVEGVADYVRFFVFEPGKIGRISPNSHYNQSYRTSAAFLAFVTNKYDKQLVIKLNKLMREGHYKSEVFKDMTGKNLTELDDEWRETLRH